MNEKTNARIDRLFDELVPRTGKADSLAGEIIRAICRIGYRFTNDGDCLGIGYGKETCNPAGRFLEENTNEEIAGIVRMMWGNPDESAYEKQLDTLAEAVLEYVESHPELRSRETEDMFSYTGTAAPAQTDSKASAKPIRKGADHNGHIQNREGKRHCPAGSGILRLAGQA